MIGSGQSSSDTHHAATCLVINAPAGDPARDYPFYAPTVDLASEGYVEQEFFIEGRANRYETPSDVTGHGTLDVTVGGTIRMIRCRTTSSRRPRRPSASRVR